MLKKWSLSLKREEPGAQNDASGVSTGTQQPHYSQMSQTPPHIREEERREGFNNTVLTPTSHVASVDRLDAASVNGSAPTTPTRENGKEVGSSPGGNRRFSLRQPMNLLSPPVVDAFAHYHHLKKLMQRLVVKAEKDGQPVREVECSTSHDFVIRPHINRALKYLLGPAVMGLQLVVFTAIYSRLSVDSCTDFSQWDNNVKLGIPLAIGYVSAEIAASTLRILRIYFIGFYSRNVWTILCASVMAGQTAFECIVYSYVMAASTGLVELIQNFVALAVTNEVDDKVAALLVVKGTKIMFLDVIEDGEEYCALSRESAPLPDGLWELLKSIGRLIRSCCTCKRNQPGLPGANHLRWAVNNPQGWAVRLLLFMAAYATIVSLVVQQWSAACALKEDALHFTSYAFFDPYIFREHNQNGTLYKWLGSQNMTYADYFPSSSVLPPATLAGEPYEFDILMPQGFPFYFVDEAAYRYFHATLHGNGYVSFDHHTRSSEWIDWSVLPLQEPEQLGVIAPFYSDLNTSTGTVYLHNTGSSVMIVFEDVEVDNSGCEDKKVADGMCDRQNNNNGCGWDGGDCCQSTHGQYHVSQFLPVVPADWKPTKTNYLKGWNSADAYFHAWCDTDQDAFFQAGDLMRKTDTPTITFELVFTSLGDVRISYPKFVIPDSARYTIGFQWETTTAMENAMSKLQYDSTCTGRQCTEVRIQSGDSIALLSQAVAYHYGLYENYRGEQLFIYDGDPQFSWSSGSSFDTEDVYDATSNADLLFADDLFKYMQRKENFASWTSYSEDPPELTGTITDNFRCAIYALESLSNGKCEPQFNTARCAFDGGDCCASTCVSSSEYLCSKNNFSQCKDPCAKEKSGYMMC